MGLKLSTEEIEKHIIEHPTLGFDICSVCDGTESQMVMESINEHSFDLICDECITEKKR
jgi:hypothetical protein